ncbi:acetate/propionate family kinase [Terracidiphilus sp.]|uniref:acetate/propionate family kinase n=1 Tax=Terracidiphilus sp. TaxID=1964191 RepID=UPI003C1DC242
MASMPVLVLNSGSSSIKFSIYEASGDSRVHLLEGAVEGIGTDEGQFWIKNSSGDDLVKQKRVLRTPAEAFSLIAEALQSGDYAKPAAIGHRVVSGGPTVLENQRITPELIDEMERYTDFAPLHTPIAVFIMRESLRLFPDVPNFACLDTWFHRTLPEVARELPIPREYAQMGVRRYGAHGISYESIVYQLQPHVPERLIVAHLGNGSSICAIDNGASIDTSMGLTPTGGIISATRTGDIDPGVLLFILRKIAATTSSAREAADKLETVASKEAGLLGVSGVSSDMRDLRTAIQNGNEQARLAVDLFVHSIRKFIGAYIAELGGIDMLVLTGGIGVNDTETRAEICTGLEPLGIVLDPERNNVRDAATISATDSRVEIRVIPPEEDLMIVNHVVRLLASLSVLY